MWPGNVRKKNRELAQAAAGQPIDAPILVKGGSSMGATIYKANIGHRTARMIASLFAVVVADTPEEAVSLLLRWSKGDAQIHGFIRNGEFILEVINPYEKGVL